MKNIIELTRVLLKERLRSKNVAFGGKSSDSGKKNYVAFWIVLAVVFVPLLAMIALMAFSIGQAVAQSVNAEALFEDTLSTIISFGQLAVLVIGIVSLINTIYQGGDAKLLAALPIKPSEIFIAKLICVYVFELGTSVAISAFVLLPFGLGYGIGAAFAVGLLLEMLLMPALPMLIATILGFPLMLIVSKLKNKGFVTVLIMCLGFAALIVVYYYVLNGIDAGIDGMNSEQIVQYLSAFVTAVGEAMLPNLIMARMLAASSIGAFLLNLGLTLLIDAVVLGIAIWIASKLYNRILLRGQESGGEARRGDGISYGSLTKELIKRDFRYITRYSALGFQSFMSVIIAIVLPFVLMFGVDEGLELPIEASGLYGFVYTMLIVFIASSNAVASGAFSREGGNVALLKTMPIAPNEIIKAKVITAFYVDVVTVVVGMAAVTIIQGISFIPFILGVVLALIMRLFGCLVAVYVDLKKPCLVWKTPAEGLKNSPAALMAMLFGFLSVVAAAICAVIGASLSGLTFGVEFYLCAYGGTAIIMAVAIVIMLKKLKNEGSSLFYAIEV